MVAEVPERSIVEWREDSGATTATQCAGSRQSDSTGFATTVRFAPSGCCKRADKAAPAAGIGSQWCASVPDLPDAHVQLFTERVADAGAVLHGDVGPAGSIYQGTFETAYGPGADHCTRHVYFGNAVFEVSHNRRSGS